MKYFVSGLLTLGLLRCAANDAGTVCTLIACQDGLSIEFDGELPSAFTLTVDGDEQEPQDIQCPESPLCAGDRILVGNFLPKKVTVTLSANGRTQTQDFTPDYKTLTPNGTDCGGQCQQASITFKVE